MCGIVSAFGKNAKQAVMNQYDEQRSRGNDGFGFIALRKGRIVANERATSEAEIEQRLSDLPKVDAILFHHRWPTSTQNVAESNHPIPLSHKEWQHKYYLLHNGHATYSDAQYSEILKDDYRFQTKVTEVSFVETASGQLQKVYGTSQVNDSEVLGYFIAEMLEGRRHTIPLYGAMAVMVVQEDSNGVCRVFAFRNTGNPLTQRESNGTLIIASEDGQALVSETLYEVTGRQIRAIGTIDTGLSYQSNYQYNTLHAAPASSTEKGTQAESDYYAVENESDAITRTLLAKQNELEFWEEELYTAKGAEAEAIRQEIKSCDAEIEQLQNKLEYSDYGSENTTHNFTF